MLTDYLPDSAPLMADSLMARTGPLTRVWTYENAVVWRGLEEVWRLTGDGRYFEAIREALDTFVDAQGNIRTYAYETFNLDNICSGRQLLLMYRETGEERYRLAADRLREQLAHHPRTTDGGFWHKQIYPWQMWLDGLYMAEPFYLDYALMAGEGEDTLRDVAQQFILAWEHTLDPATGLNCHAWDERHQQAWADAATGRAPHVWCRAMGWYLAGLADVLERFPRTHPCRETLRGIFLRMADKLLAIREQGVWYQVLDCPGRPGNYLESSGSCLIVYAILKAARLGDVPVEMGLAAQESFRAIQRQFVGRMRSGTIFLSKCCAVGGLGGTPYRDGSFDYYISEPVVSYDPKGTGAYIQAACEMARSESRS
ncbi:MAG: glycoside hydrolase family 105 protein [Aristaeellaceae bacterium]